MTITGSPMSGKESAEDMIIYQHVIKEISLLATQNTPPYTSQIIGEYSVENSFSYSVTKLPYNLIKLHFYQITPTHRNRIFQQSLKELSKDVAIPGFRQGKAPQKLYEEKLAKELAEKTFEAHIAQAISAATSQLEAEWISKEKGKNLHLACLASSIQERDYLKILKEGLDEIILFFQVQPTEEGLFPINAKIATIIEEQKALAEQAPSFTQLELDNYLNIYFEALANAVLNQHPIDYLPQADLDPNWTLTSQAYATFMPTQTIFNHVLNPLMLQSPGLFPLDFNDPKCPFSQEGTEHLFKQLQLSYTTWCSSPKEPTQEENKNCTLQQFLHSDLQKAIIIQLQPHHFKPNCEAFSSLMQEISLLSIGNKKPERHKDVSWYYSINCIIEVFKRQYINGEALSENLMSSPLLDPTHYIWEEVKQDFPEESEAEETDLFPIVKAKLKEILPQLLRLAHLLQTVQRLASPLLTSIDCIRLTDISIPCTASDMKDLTPKDPIAWIKKSVSTLLTAQYSYNLEDSALFYFEMIEGNKSFEDLDWSKNLHKQRSCSLFQALFISYIIRVGRYFQGTNGSSPYTPPVAWFSLKDSLSPQMKQNILLQHARMSYRAAGICYLMRSLID
jgi:hypothetical protein